VTPPNSHYRHEIQDFLDGRLGEPDRSRLAEHLSGCEQCRRELEALRWVKVQALGRLPVEETPPELVSRVRAALDAEAASSRGGGRSRARLPAARWALAATLAAAAIVLYLVSRAGSEPRPGRVARDFVEVAAGRARLGVTTREPRMVEEYFRRNGIPFATRVFDLGMMGYDLQGGRVHRMNGRPSALFTYRGADGRLIVYQMYQGSAAELPPPEETRERDGVTFLIYREGNTTVVFWQEGDVVCVLASDAPSESVIQLAFAKAIKL
jgi:anti-sigma factor RsiW